MPNPSVGETCETSSPLSRFSTVVFPALSRPLRMGMAVSYRHMLASCRLATHRNNTLISFSFILFLRMIVSSPVRIRQLQRGSSGA